MKKFRILPIILLTCIFIKFGYASSDKTIPETNLSPVGYWVQFDEDKDVGFGKIQGIVHAYFAKDNEHGNKGTLEMQIAVPIMEVVDNNIQPVPVHCDACGEGSVNDFKYNYKSSNNNLMQGLVFAGNLQPQKNTSEDDKSLEFSKGGVLNPNNGKTYNSKAQVQDNGETLFVRAYKGSTWYAVGKNGFWKRITELQYKKIKEKCGLNQKGFYPYQNADGELINKKLFEECYSYDFNVTKPV